MKTRRKGPALILAALLALAAPIGALAATFEASDYAGLLLAMAAINDLPADVEAVLNITGNITYDAGDTTVKFTRDVEITGETDDDGNALYAITGNDTVRLIAVEGDLTISNLTLANGYADGQGPGSSGGYGGALYVDGDAEITGCTFTDNESTIKGGAVYVTGSVEITESMFEDNATKSGGGAVYAVGDIDITNTAFESNKALNGGAVFGEVNVFVDGGTFVGNEASDAGGAIYTASETGLTVGDTYITNSMFEGNEAGVYGGAVGAFDGDLSVSDTLFIDNKSDYDGGAIASIGDLAIAECKFEGNQAGGAGGAIIAFGDTTIEKSEFTDNEAGMAGGAVNAQAGTTTTIIDSAFTNNETTTSNGGAVASLADVVIDGSAFEGNTASGNGGAVRANGSAVINDSTFESNTAGNDGGAVWISGQATNTDNSSVTDSDFYNNTSGNVGSALYSQEDLTVDGANYFDGNTDSHGDPNGNAPEGRENLGIYMDGASLIMGAGAELIEGRRPSPQPGHGGEPSRGPAPVYEKAVIGNCKEWVNVRSGPGMDSEVFGRAYLGEIVELLQWNDGETWCKVLFSGGNNAGWVHGKFIIPQRK